MKRRSFLVLFTLPTLTTFSLLVSPTRLETVDEVGYEEYLHYWCPTPAMIESERNAKTYAQGMYRVIPAEEWDV